MPQQQAHQQTHRRQCLPTPQPLHLHLPPLLPLLVQARGHSRLHSPSPLWITLWLLRVASCIVSLAIPTASPPLTRLGMTLTPTPGLQWLLCLRAGSSQAQSAMALTSMCSVGGTT